VRKRGRVEGVVQAVGFRVAVAQRARSRGVAGWVRNVPDGRVEAVFEGDAVDELVEFCRVGPRGAVVSRVEVSDEEPEGLSSFDIR
jgi:acylphosphatase